MPVRFASDEHSESGPSLSIVHQYSSNEDNNTMKLADEMENFDLNIQQGHPDELNEGAMTNLTAVAESIKEGNGTELVIALFETGQALQNCREYAIQVLVPLICEQASDWDYDIKVSAGETLLTVVNSGNIPEDIARKISRTAIVVIGTPCLQEMFETWSDTLVAVLKYISWSAVQLDWFLGILERAYKPPNNVLSRQLTARVLGSLAASAKEEDDLKRRILDRALILSGDKNVIVRGMVAESFAYIGASVSLSVVERDIWPRLERLLRDKDARIHAASLQSLSYISSANREKGEESKFFAKLLAPIFLKECFTMRRDAAEDQRDVDDGKCLLLEVNSEIFGELLYTCCDSLRNDDEKKGVYQAFQAMCIANGPLVRRYCAYNMPAVCLCLTPEYRAELSNLVRFLSQDKDNETRWVLAAGIHETVKALANKDSISDLVGAIQALIMDEKRLVRKNVLSNFEGIIAKLTTHFGYAAAEKLGQLFQNLDVLKETWMVQVTLAKQFQLAAPLIPPACLRMDVIPLLNQLADNTAYIGRKSIMKAMAICIRYIPDIRERHEVMGRFVVDWARGSIFWMRIAFMDAAEAAADTYSRCLFRDTFASEVLRLALDQVPNIRIRAALILPKIASACNLMEEFHSATETLKKDEDIDVAYAMEGIDAKIAAAIEEGYKTFEADMEREDEEQELYSRHLKAQREVLKKKAAKKRRSGRFLLAGRPKGSLNSFSWTALQSVTGAAVEPGDGAAESPANRFGSSRSHKGSTHSSATGGVTGNVGTPRGKTQRFPSSAQGKVQLSSAKTDKRSASRASTKLDDLSLVDGDESRGPGARNSSPIAVGSTSFSGRTGTLKGLMSLVSPRNKPPVPHKGGKTKRNIS